MNLRLIVASLLLCTAPGTLNGQEAAPPPLDGPNRVFHDELLDNMAGKWKLMGTLVGQTADQTVEAEWVLNHQFLRIHEKDSAPQKNAPAYEAMVFVGYDNASERYVTHWLDNFGGRFSETLGYGHRNSDAIELIFEYPDGPFRTTFQWNTQAKTWRWLMKTKDKRGNWADFANLTLTRAE